MSTKFAAGDRVRVSEKFFWAKGATGKIATPPDEVTQKTGAWERGLTWREVSDLGTNVVYWVWFDVPQFAAGDDGPYIGGCIWDSALSKI